ncbi:prephenate/arogenate dehydrogenase [Synechococcus sp. PCC 6312]|uniref:prephenate/arogenate dehydrogenase n=1 Tax=Synechococcus sp. (strain ATCC 27167 / PCC 6312) TaxID=195253 RepID=UPI00029F3370|nr:prephenate/arogenate dehydrogenase [Synechococcus sp. PCC 6312]AFY60608.1 prephenate dehydrogenase [Synechococcus sp. PCC 6312]
MQIGIVGLGLIGGSLGLDLRGLGHEVFGLSRQKKTCEVARERGIVNQASPDPRILSTCDLVFLCPPLGQMVSVAQQIQPVLHPQAILTDVGSVKGAICQTLTHVWPRFIGGHPMAGTAASGVLAAQEHLFDQRPYVLTPIPETDPEALALLSQLVDALGATRYLCSPEAHDRAVAWISHLPVMVSAALIGAGGQEPELAQLAQALASSGFRDTSRVGGGNPELGRMMAEFNQAELLFCLRIYQQELTALVEKIAAGDWPGLEQYLTMTKKLREQYSLD